jgi:glycerol-3-phosphate dehydrogenase subunit B
VTYDVVVVGAGTAGLVAAVKLAEEGARVAVYARGVGAIQLAPSTIDVLGYDPDPVDSPARALGPWVDRHPDHPYARVGIDGVREALTWFSAGLGALGYAGGLERNLLLASPVGALRRCAAAPEAIAAGDLRSVRRVAIVGWRALKDFFAGLAADNLARSAAAAGIELEVRGVDLPVGPAAGDTGPLGWARRFEDARWRRDIVAELRGRLRSEDAVGWPAVLGLDAHREVRRDLENGLGASVFEIPTLPPSVPGLRLFKALKSRLRAARARLVIGAPVAAARVRNGRVDSVGVQTAARVTTVRAPHYVLASGGWASGGIAMDSRWEVRETVFDLPVPGAPGPGETRLRPAVFDDHPLDALGVIVDDDLRPLTDGGSVALANVHVAGATIAGARPWREKSGDGISLATGYRAATAILEERM